MQPSGQIRAPLDSLEEEFQRLKRVLKLDSDLEIRWLQNGGRKNLAGEVRNNIVFIYDADYESALRTLRHELLDYMISKAIEPYKEITNRLILLWNEEAYRRKEEVVERLEPLLGASAL